MFKFSPEDERGYHVFPNFPDSLIKRLDLSSLNKWFTNHKKRVPQNGASVTDKLSCRKVGKTVFGFEYEMFLVNEKLIDEPKCDHF